MSKYQELLNNEPNLKIKDNATEVIFTLVSCMCDNISYIRFKKNSDNEFKLSHYNNNVGLAFSNLQCKYPTHEILWEADDNNWIKVITMLNTGTSLIADVKSRAKGSK